MGFVPFPSAPCPNLRERDELERADFCQQLASIDESQLVYIDESGMDQGIEALG
ncbi:MAG: hypothetical protein ACFB0C_20795 [Leptolyngbyaceae cyanobacterium]